MTIGIDISQIVYEGTGVSNYVKQLVLELLKTDHKNNYILFGSSLRKQNILNNFVVEAKKLNPKTRSKILPLPISWLNIIWNVWHIIPIEVILGKIEVFWSSDWVQPPLKKAIGITTIHDLTIYRYPESFAKKILQVHHKKLARSMKNCSIFICDSEATKNDVKKILGIAEAKLRVIYPGIKIL